MDIIPGDGLLFFGVRKLPEESVDPGATVN